jgi:hypothetical protein
MAVLTPLKGLAPPTMATQAKSINVNSYMLDQGGMLLQAIQQTTELRTLLQQVAYSTDAADPNLTVINAAIANLG